MPNSLGLPRKQRNVQGPGRSPSYLWHTFPTCLHGLKNLLASGRGVCRVKRVADIYRRKFGDQASQKSLSPVTHVAEDKQIPPFLILHVAEHPETKMQSQRLAKELRDADISATAYPAENKDHTSINADLGLPGDEPTKVLFEFVREALADEQPAGVGE